MKIPYSWCKYGRHCDKRLLILKQINLSAFSLFELLIVLCVIGILLLITGPSIKLLYQHNQFQCLEKRLLSSLRFARSQATLSGRPVAVRLDGRRVLVSEVEGSRVLRQWVPGLVGLSIHWRGTGREKYAVVFQPDGSTMGQQGSFWLNWKQYASRIIVLMSGRLRIARSDESVLESQFSE